MNAVTIDTVAHDLGNTIIAFRSAAVTSENKATPMARSMLAALLTGATSPDLIVALVLQSFGNPKSPKGKPLDKLSGSGDYLTGFGATRKTVDTIFKVWANVDADKERDVDGVAMGKGEVRALIVQFCLGHKDAPKSLRALSEAIGAMVKAFAASIMPPADEAKEEAEKALAEQQGKADPVEENLSLADRISLAMLAYEASDMAGRIAVHAQLEQFWDMVNADVASEAVDVEEAAGILLNVA